MDWWTNAETFHASTAANDWGQNGHFDWGTLAQSKFTFTTHCPIDKNFIDRCHQMGIRCFPYVSFYFGPNHVTFGPISSNTYEGVDFSQHLEFFEWGQNLQPRQWEFSPSTPDGVGMFFTPTPFVACPNFEPYRQKMLDWVKYIMQQGADGIFVDNLVKRMHCYANHPHTYPENPSDPDAAQNQAFTFLLSQVKNLVKSYRPDGLVIGNSGDPLQILKVQTWPGFQQYLDADTIEGYVCGNGSRLQNWQGRLSWDQLGRQLQPYFAQGKQILAISGMGNFGKTPPDPQFREDSFLCYCSARLAGITWYGGPMGDPGLADLHRVRLGKALTPEGTDSASQINYRVFEHGIVAVNWDGTTHSFQGQQIAATALGMSAQTLQFFYDLFTPGNTPVDMNATSGLLQLPPQAGRVFLFGSSTDYGLNRLSS